MSFPRIVVAGMAFLMLSACSKKFTSEDASPDIEISYQKKTVAKNGVLSAGRFAIGSTTQIKITIKNVGAAELKLLNEFKGQSGPVIISDVTGVFTGVTQPSATLLAPTEETTFTMDVYSNLLGIYQSKISILSNAASGVVFEFTLEAEAADFQPDLKVEDNSVNIPGNSTVDFGSVVTSSPKTVVRTIRNAGSADLTISALNLSGANAADYSATADSMTIPPGGSTNLNLTVVSASAGNKVAQLQINSNDPDTPSFLLNLQATVTAGPQPEIQIEELGVSLSSGGSNTFGDVLVGSSSSTRVFTIRNLGTANLDLTGTPKVNVSGANASDFQVTAQPGTPIASGQTDTFAIKFVPGATGARTAVITILNNDSDEGAYTLNVSGNGVATPNYYVAVTNSGEILYSLDPTTTPWTQQTFSGQIFQGIAHGNGTFVASARSGLVYYAGDPTASWTSVTLSGISLARVRYIGSDFIVCGGSGTIFYTNNPSGAWSQVNTGSSDDLKDIAYNGTVYVAVGRKRAIMTASSLAGPWTNNSMGNPGDFESIASDGGEFVAVGGNNVAYKSSDGTTWTSVSPGPGKQLEEVFFDGSAYIAVGNNGLMMSSPNPFSSWASNPLFTATWSAITKGGIYYILAGSGGNMAYSLSINGPWILIQPDGTSTIKAVAYGD